MASDIDTSVVGVESWECEKCTFINKAAELTCLMCYTVRVSTKELSVNWQWQASAEQWIPYDLPTTLQIEEAFQKGAAEVDLNKGYFASVPNYTIAFQRTRKSKKAKSKEDESKVTRVIQTNTSTGNVRYVRRLGDGTEMFEEVKWDLINDEEKCSICQMEFLDPPETSSSSPSTVEPVSTMSEVTPLKLSEVTPLKSGKKRHSKDIKSGIKTRSHSKIPKSSSDSTILPKTDSSVLSKTMIDESDEKQDKQSQSLKSIPKSSHPEESPVKLPKCSNHYFHKNCLIQWLKLQDHCPYCKTKL